MAKLTAPHGALSFFLDQEPKAADFRADALAGLAASPKKLAPKYFYDARGSALFEAICETPEYYVTRTELSLMRSAATDMAAALGRDASIIEYGSGASEKIALLLDACDAVADYVAIDISREALLAAAGRVAEERPNLAVGAICADFFGEIALPADHLRGSRNAGYFPGSTLGNFEERQAIDFLARARRNLGPGAEFLIGVDLVKDEDILLSAYDDAAGVTADFNTNVLLRMKSELDARIEIGAFRHRAIWNADLERIEMHLEATRATEIVLDDRSFAFAEGETIHTESSHKYTEARLRERAEAGGWSVSEIWKDARGWFAVALLV
ncbi:MAG: L-histidine N(alpha)-methyltransferase [Pseudomonadota bacterium]